MKISIIKDAIWSQTKTFFAKSGRKLHLSMVDKSRNQHCQPRNFTKLSRHHLELQVLTFWSSHSSRLESKIHENFNDEICNLNSDKNVFSKVSTLKSDKNRNQHCQLRNFTKLSDRNQRPCLKIRRYENSWAWLSDLAMQRGSDMQ